MSMMVCSLCNDDPCKLKLHKEALNGKLSLLQDSLDSSKKRNHFYGCYIQAENGMIRHGIHVHIPECVIAFINSICPNDDGTYTWHHDIDDGGCDEDVTSDTNHHNVELQSNKKMKVCVSFKNSQFQWINYEFTCGRMADYIHQRWIHQCNINCETEPIYRGN